MKSYNFLRFCKLISERFSFERDASMIHANPSEQKITHRTVTAGKRERERIRDRERERESRDNSDNMWLLQWSVEREGNSGETLRLLRFY